MNLPSFRAARCSVFTLALTASMALFPVVGVAGDSYQGGTMSNITSTPDGLMIMLDSGVPTNCNGTPYGYMLIPQANKTMIATALLTWVSGNRQVTVYTSWATPGNGYCTINQFDPA
jgi:hypothetical protein